MTHDIPERSQKVDVYARGLDVEFDVDLGELIDGHRVVARGVLFGEQGMSLEYDFVPGMTKAETDERPFFWYWFLEAHDDIGTEYDDSKEVLFQRPEERRPMAVAIWERLSVS